MGGLVEIDKSDYMWRLPLTWFIPALPVIVVL
jgi:hypothetical protein